MHREGRGCEANRSIPRVLCSTREKVSPRTRFPIAHFHNASVRQEASDRIVHPKALAEELEATISCAPNFSWEVPACHTGFVASSVSLSHCT